MLHSLAVWLDPNPTTTPAIILILVAFIVVILRDIVHTAIETWSINQQLKEPTPHEPLQESRLPQALLDTLARAVQPDP